MRVTTQQAFAAALLAPGSACPEGLRTHNGSDPETRFAVQSLEPGANAVLQAAQPLFDAAHRGVIDDVRHAPSAAPGAVRKPSGIW